MSVLRYFQLTGLLQANGWQSNMYVGVDEQGIIQYLNNSSPDGVALEVIHGYAIPGFQNTHSHAFQYAMSALAENHTAGTTDDFWSWREAMYQCALTVNPDQAESIATMLYAEMLRLGYTHVAEFHYLHHDTTGNKYSNLSEMGERMVAAAKTVGIGITLIPVLYQMGGFGQPPQARQRRFISTNVDDYFKLLDASKKAVAHYSMATLGCSVHSLRAVSLNDVVTTIQSCPSKLPIHLHIAEQLKEVEDCLQFCGQRPVQWLLDHVSVNARFHLVHATHLDDHELQGIAQSKAHVIVCPSTEGNLGDGFFRMKEYVAMGGRWSIGTDSHIGLNPMEEFRMIDYRQRLLTNRRNTFTNDAAHYMISESLQSGWSAMGITPQYFSIGVPFSALIVDAESPLLSCTTSPYLSSTIVYSSDPSHYVGTIMNGKWVVKYGHHIQEERIRKNFKEAIDAIKIR